MIDRLIKDVLSVCSLLIDAVVIIADVFECQFVEADLLKRNILTCIDFYIILYDSFIIFQHECEQTICRYFSVQSDFYNRGKGNRCF